MRSVLIDRRAVLLGASALGAAGLETASPAARRADSPFPHGFLWGAATAAHQVEGNNVNSDFWLLEHLKPSPFAEPSGDACDSWNRHFDDVKLVARLGLNAYRFSVEWARIEPERAAFSLATLAYYRRLAMACREAGIAPIVTYNHFTLPIWLAARGGWEAPDIVDGFAHYCERVAHALGDLPAAHCTINEPNQTLLPYLIRGETPQPGEAAIIALAARNTGSDRFGTYGSGDRFRTRDAMMAAHRVGGDAIRASAPGAQVGLTLALQDLIAVPGGETLLARLRQETRAPWYDLVRRDEFVGIQSYERVRIGAEGFVKAPDNVLRNDDGAEIGGDVLGTTLREVATATGRPLLVSEHGVNTADDALRIRVIDAGVTSLSACLAEGLVIKGYCHWSLMDNFEWLRGYRPKFGLCSVDRTSFARTPKPSAWHLGRIAQRNGQL